MTHALTQEDEQTLTRLRAALLRDAPPPLRPDQGTEAFRRHKLLASAVHNAATLHQSAGDNETQAWLRYIADFFPDGRNGKDDALILWKHWRCALLKNDKPTVPITHGQSHAHWQRDDQGRPIQNLEDAWDDYASSVDRFIEHLRTNIERCAIVLDRFRERETKIVRYDALAGATAMSFSASASGSVSIVTPPDVPRRGTNS